MSKDNTLGTYRWRICALLFFATTINYLDRQVISLLKDDYFEPLFGWTERDYSFLVICFQVAYAVGMLGAGWLIDKIGTKLGYAVSIVLWSVAAVLHAFAKGIPGFAAARAFLGISEAGNFPSAIKTVAEWFPKKERALATGVFNSGANIGAIVAPLTVPLIALHLGWEWAFIATGLTGFIWLYFWFRYYEIPKKQNRLGEAELRYISADQPIETAADGKPVRWLSLLGYRQTWAFVVGKFLTDPIWWFYLFWLPSFLNKEYGLQKTELALPVALVYVLASVGSIFGGWLSGHFMSRGMDAHHARKKAMLIFAFMAVPVVVAQAAGSLTLWFAVIIIGIAAAGHQAWSANLYSVASDIFPKKVVASIVGIGSMAGAVGGIIIAQTAGYLLDYFKSQGAIESGYYVMFFICGSAYLLAWLLMNQLIRKNETLEF
ncbi:MAG: MFS transporter [Cyclobacteriaceae bacterium]|nr:MFS transporter [Cyclobacteriaceae bacterium]